MPVKTVPLKVTALRHDFVESVPRPLEEGVLYVSIKFRTAIHLCCCGCQSEVVTPISPAKWTLLFHGKTVSLHPSIGNWALPCQSHYWIQENNVIASGRMTSAEIEKNRVQDKTLSTKYYAGGEPLKSTPQGFFKKFFKK